MAEELSVFSVQSQSFQQVTTAYATILLHAFSALNAPKTPKPKKQTPPYALQ